MIRQRIENDTFCTEGTVTPLKDPKHLFNSSLDGKVRRAIDIGEGKKVDATAFKALVREAIALNRAGKAKPAKKAVSKPRR